MSGISPIAHSMESATRYVRLDPPQHVTARMMQQFAAGEPVDGGTDMPKPTTPSQGLDAATVERCAQVAESCAEAEWSDRGVQVAEWVAAAIRALATEPHQHGGKGA